METRELNLIIDYLEKSKDLLEQLLTQLKDVRHKECQKTDSINNGQAAVEENKETYSRSWLTLDEVCTCFVLPKNSIKSRKWRTDHHFPYHQPEGIYGKVYYNYDEIDQWLKEKTSL